MCDPLAFWMIHNPLAFLHRCWRERYIPKAPTSNYRVPKQNRHIQPHLQGILRPRATGSGHSANQDIYSRFSCTVLVWILIKNIVTVWFPLYTRRAKVMWYPLRFPTLLHLQGINCGNDRISIKYHSIQQVRNAILLSFTTANPEAEYWEYLSSSWRNKVNNFVCLIG